MSRSTDNELDNLWCAYVLLFDDNPSLAAKVYTRMQELRLKELDRDLKRMAVAFEVDGRRNEASMLVVSEWVDSFPPPVPWGHPQPKPRRSSPT